MSDDAAPGPSVGRLQGKVAIVTGGAIGIGAAVVRLFARSGARVAFCARREAEGARLEDALREEGREVSFWPCDVSVEQETHRFVARTVARFGRVDVVVNNAGVSASGPLEAMAVEEWREVIDNNLTSMFLVCKHTIPHLRRSGSGSIVNLGSTYGLVGAAHSAAYAVTKAAAVNLSKTLALELAADRIRVNALCPGATDTPLHQRWRDCQPDPPESDRLLVARHPLSRLASPEEIALGALYLACDESSFVTGHALVVDGGYTAA